MRAEMLLISILIFGVLVSSGCFQTSCEVIQDADERDSCYLFRLTDPLIEITENDIYKCEQIISTDKKDRCYLHMAKKFPSVCEKISNQTFYKYQYHSKKLFYYDSMGPRDFLDEVNRDSCYLSVSEFYTKNESFCHMISDTGWKDYCYVTAVFNSRIWLKKEPDLSICNNIENLCLRNLCLAIVKKDPSLCIEVSACSDHPHPERSEDVKLCYLEIAKYTNNFTLCEKIYYDPEIDPENWQKTDECYMTIAINTNNSLLCDKVEFSYDHAMCYHEIARATADPSLCEKMKTKHGTNSENIKNDCFLDLAIMTSDPNLCEKINASTGWGENRLMNCYEIVGKP